MQTHPSSYDYLKRLLFSLAILVISLAALVPATPAHAEEVLCGQVVRTDRNGQILGWSVFIPAGTNERLYWDWITYDLTVGAYYKLYNPRIRDTIAPDYIVADAPREILGAARIEKVSNCDGYSASNPTPKPGKPSTKARQISFIAKKGGKPVKFNNLRISGMNQRGDWKIWTTPSSSSGFIAATTEDYWWQGTIVLTFDLLGVGRRTCVIDYLREGSSSIVPVIYTEGSGCSGEFGSSRSFKDEFDFLYNVVSDDYDTSRLVDAFSKADSVTECVRDFKDVVKMAASGSIKGMIVLSITKCRGIRIEVISEIVSHVYKTKVILGQPTPVPSQGGGGSWGNDGLSYQPFPGRDLRLTSPRMSGDDVRLVQQRLLDLGYTEVGVVDGWFGPATESAVRRFQREHNLTADGVVGPVTWEALFR